MCRETRCSVGTTTNSAADDHACGVIAERPGRTSAQLAEIAALDGVGGRKRSAVGIWVGPTVERLTCAARARVATAARHAACPHLKRAVQTA